MMFGNYSGLLLTDRRLQWGIFVWLYQTGLCFTLKKEWLSSFSRDALLYAFCQAEGSSTCVFPSESRSPGDCRERLLADTARR